MSATGYEVICPRARCRALPTNKCVDRSGKPKITPHYARIRAAQDLAQARDGA